MNIYNKFHHFCARQLNLWRLILVLLGVPSLSYATHIVGGEVGYLSLGNDRYEIIVRLYRDCAPKTEPFDPVASVGIFDRSGLLLQDVRIDATSATPLDNNLDACILAQTKVCVETMTYKATVVLPFRTGGYQIVYQRCCRNATIKNIVSPLETGATYDIWLTEAAMRRRNNSATFRRWPDIYICNNRPLDFDHSAFDLDGDSLVYRLCTPLQGATFANPRPQPPNFPPFDTLIWVKPLYDLYNMLGTVGEPLRINSTSGLLTARPGILGQFVVGICVDEYDRNTKQLISSTRRDFQYNVQNCEGVTAAFSAPETQCDSLKVNFLNTSVGASNYLWLFDTTPTAATSTVVNPMYTFPAYNTYKVSLIAEPNTTCSDTTSRQVKLVKSGIKANFKAEVLPCAAESILRLQDLSIDSSAAIVKRMWKVTFGLTGQITATGADTLVRLPANVSGTISLTVVNANGCEKTITQPFSTTGGQNPTDGILDTIQACVGTTIPLNPNGVATSVYSYRWEPASLMDNPDAVNPKYKVTQNAVVNLTITVNSVQTCTLTKTITIIASPRPVADFGIANDGGNGVASSCDGRTLSLTNKSSNADSVKWIIGDINNPLLVSKENNPTLTLGDTGTYTLTLIAYGECNDTLQKNIRLVKLETDVDFSFNYTTCILNGSTIKLVDVSNNPGVQIAGRTWKLSDGRTSTEDSPSFSFTDTGRVTITLVIRTARGCLDSASQSINKAPITGVDFPDTIVVCRGMPLQIPGNNNPNLVYMWLPDTGLDDPTVGNPIFSPQQSTLYTVNISVPGIPTCQINDTMMTVVPGNMNITVLGAGADGTPVCTPQTTLTASTNRPATFRWLDANGNELGKGATFTATVATQRNLTVEATDENGCKEKLDISLLGEPIVFAAPDSLILCTNDEPLRINTTQGPGQILAYSWTPLAAFESGALTANPVLAVTPGIKEVFVQVRNASGCSLTDSVQVIIIDANHNLDFTSEIQCDGNTVIFRNTSTNAFGYLWNFGDGTTSTEENPTHKYATAGDYTVTLTLNYDVACRKTASKSISISAGTSIGLKVPNDLTTCGETVTLTAEGKPGTSFKWTTKQGQLLSSDASVSVNPPPGTTVYYVTATKAPGCTETDSVSVTDNGVDVTLITPSGSDRIDQCDAESVQVEVRNNAPGQQLTYTWTPVFNVVSGGNTATPVLRPTNIGVNVITGIVSNQFECEDTLTVTINLGALDSGLPDTVQVCPGVATPLAPNASSEFTYQWSPGTNLSATNVRNPSFTGTAPVTYLVTVTKNSGGISCQVVDTVVVTIGLKPELKVSTLDTSACVGTTLVLTATGASGYTWLLNGTPLTPPFQSDGGLALSATQGSDTRYTVIGRNELGCTDTISGIRVRFVDFNPGQFTTPLNICKGDTVELHPTGNPAFQYQWSPSAGLNLSKPYNPVAVLSQTTRFLVTITDPVTGCFKERAIVVNVNSIEGFKASNDTSICTATGGLTLRADANGNNVTFRWTNASGTQIGTGKTISVNPEVGVNLYIVEANNGTCTQKDTVKVTLADFKPGDLTSPQSACAGQPLALNPNGNPAYTYTWSPTTGLNLTNPHNPIATLNASVTYTVTVTDPASGCRLEKEIRVNVINLSDFAIVPADTTVCQPGGVNLRVTGAEGANIRWLDANGTQIGTGRSISPSPNVGLNLYIAEASVGSCTARDTSRVTRVDFQPGDLSSPQAACAGSPLPLNPKGNPAYTYAWSPTIGLDLTNPYNPIATLIASVTYTVTVTDPATGCSIEKEIRVNVTDLGDLEAIPSETILCQPDFVFLTARGAQGATIRWLDANGQVIFNGRNLSVTPAVGLNLYIVEATLGSCIKRDTARVRLSDFKPGDLKSPQTICAGSSVELNPNGNPAYSYTWSPTTGLDLSKPYNPIASPTNTTTYTVTVSDPASGCSATKTIVVNVTQPITVIALPDTSLCEPGRLTLRATTSRPTPITWFSDAALKNQIGTGNRISVNVAAGKTVFYAVATDTNDVCIRAQIDSARNGGGGPGTGGGPTIGKGGPFEGAPLDSAVVDVVDITSGAPPSMITTCAGRPTPINPNGKPNLVYRWSPSTGLNDSTSATPTTIVTVPTTYTVTISDPFGACSIVRQVVVMAAEPINANAGKDTTLCSLNPYNLTASGNGAAIFEWGNNRNINPVLGQGAQFSIIPDTVAKTYYVRITNAAGCVEIDSVTVIARPVRASLPATVNACENGDEVTLIVTNNDPRQTLTYLWSPANLFITNVRTGPSATIIAQNGAQPQVLLTNQYGCTATLRTTVNVVDLANKVRVTANPTTIENGESTTIRVENCPDCTYSWSPATGLNTTTGSTVIASPTDTTEYTVKVTSNGCMAELKITINVSGPYCVEPYIFVPTAFTPNSDGVNDVLYVRGRGIDRMTFIIYNRWGQKMFETSDPKVGWDGTFRGKKLPADVYGFYLLANCIDGTTYRKQGNVTLIR